MSVKAVLWDYDATLVDSARKNMEVIAAVLRHFDPDIDSHLPRAVLDYDYYQKVNHGYVNWQELYMNEFGVREEDLEEAAALWGPEQLKNGTTPDMFPGMAELLLELDAIPMGICSQNDRENMMHVFRHYGVEGCFDAVIGCTDVTGRAQKPDPEGFLKCIAALEKDGPLSGETIVYVGDHRDDVSFGKNAEKILDIPVFCITFDALGLNGEERFSWDPAPDAYVNSVPELKDVLEKLI